MLSLLKLHFVVDYHPRGSVMGDLFGDATEPTFFSPLSLFPFTTHSLPLCVANANKILKGTSLKHAVWVEMLTLSKSSLTLLIVQHQKHIPMHHN